MKLLLAILMYRVQGWWTVHTSEPDANGVPHERQFMFTDHAVPEYLAHKLADMEANDVASSDSQAPTDREG